MAYASRSGRARTSPSNPQAHSICDRCGGRYNHVDLNWQYDWAGAGLINKRILVCDTCTDTPQQQLRTIVLPADPTPVMNARPEDFVNASTDFRVTMQNSTNLQTGIPVYDGEKRGLMDGGNRVTQQTGFANGSLNERPGTDPNAVTYRTVAAAYDSGSGPVRLVLNTTNGMITGQKVTVRGVVGVSTANGEWVVTVVSPIQIDLQGSVFSGSYTSGGYVINNPSLPYGNTTVPETGPI